MSLENLARIYFDKYAKQLLATDKTLSEYSRSAPMDIEELISCIFSEMNG